MLCIYIYQSIDVKVIQQVTTAYEFNDKCTFFISTCTLGIENFKQLQAICYNVYIRWPEQFGFSVSVWLSEFLPPVYSGCLLEQFYVITTDAPCYWCWWQKHFTLWHGLSLWLCLQFPYFETSQVSSLAQMCWEMTWSQIILKPLLLLLQNIMTTTSVNLVSSFYKTMYVFTSPDLCFTVVTHSSELLLLWSLCCVQAQVSSCILC